VSRVLAVDWGERRVGVALSDLSGSLASPLPTIYTSSEAETVRAVIEIVTREEVIEVVVGLPLNMDGSRGEAAESAQSLADRLKQETGVPVVMWDERLTSAQARRLSNEVGARIGRRKDLVDARAAELLLQSYLDSRRGRSGAE
jgi:putative Holliday junction resolvase